MSYRQLFILLTFFFSAKNSLVGQHEKQHPAMNVSTYPAFESQYVQARQVDVYLPENYPAEGRYQVLYMHDGQNLVNPSTAYGGVTWKADSVIAELVKSGKIASTILVGIWNTPARYREYGPMPAFSSLSDSTVRKIEKEYQGLPYSDRYLQFLVEELKPFIDANYATRPEPEFTSICGSSMGGLISLYAICRYPEVFGRAGCVSIHWPILTRVGDPKLFNNFIAWLPKHLPKDGKHRIYFDHGTVTLDSLYQPYQQRIDALMRQIAFPETHWKSKVFEGAAHNEASWQARLPEVFEYLLGDF